MARILILNDEPGIIEALATVLGISGYISLKARTNEEAISILRAQPIDLLIQDIGRPGMDGWQFARLMKADPQMREVPILITSGSPPTIHPEYLVLVEEYITLPFHFEEFLGTVERILSKKYHVAAGRSCCSGAGMEGS